MGTAVAIGVPGMGVSIGVGDEIMVADKVGSATIAVLLGCTAGMSRMMGGALPSCTGGTGVPATSSTRTGVRACTAPTGHICTSKRVAETFAGRFG